MNRFDLYRWCVQDPARMVRFVSAVHGGKPRVLREDFSGAASLSAAWVRVSKSHSAVAVDRDAEPLRHALKHERVHLRRADVRTAKDKADVVALFNFAVCELHKRAELVKYFRHLRTCLNARGVVVMDIYGGRNAWSVGETKTHARTDGGERINYTWEQRAANPVSGMVENAMHFRVGTRVWRDAFVYHWRLWSIAELREALQEAGFALVELYDRMGTAVDGRGRLMVTPMSGSDELDDDYVVYIAARK